jgi:hypothetical protein
MDGSTAKSPSTTSLTATVKTSPVIRPTPAATGRLSLWTVRTLPYCLNVAERDNLAVGPYWLSGRATPADAGPDRVGSIRVDSFEQSSGSPRVTAYDGAGRATTTGRVGRHS